MTDAATLLLFVLACVALIVTPGPDLAHIVARSLAQGRRAGMAATLGVAVGSFGHGVLGAVGIGELFRASPAAFDALRWAGAAYLAWLAWSAFMGRDETATAEARRPDTFLRILRQGALTNLLNPKVAVFYLAFVPQFIDPAAGPVWAQFLVLAAVLNLLSVAIMGTIVAFAGSAAGWVSGRPAARRLQRGLLGTVFGVLALRMAWPERA